jgi:LTXXQ motif family protein
MSHRAALSTLTVILALATAPVFAEEQHHSAGSAPAAATAPQAMAGMGQGTQGGMPMGMMCGMMRQSGTGSMPMGGMPMMADRTEGRIAFLRTELKITDAQLPLWNAVADAIRANAKGGMSMMSNMGQGSLTERLAAREKHLTTQAEALQKFKSAVDPLYAALTDEQKKTADELLMSPMGMM